MLVIEDDEMVRRALVTLLADQGYEVACASNGRDGLQRARERHPDVILLDLMMPVMDGCQFRSEQKRDATIADIPVVVVSAVGSDIDAAAFLPKPFTRLELLNMVHQLIPRAGAKATARRPTYQGHATVDDRPEPNGTVIMTSPSRPAGPSELSILEAIPDAVVVCDHGGRIRYVNRAVLAVLGYEAAEVLGLPLEMMIPARFRAPHRVHLEAYFAAPRTRPMGVGMQLVALRKDGTEVPVEISLAPVDVGTETWSVAAVRDVTQRQALEDRERRLAKAEQEIRQRDEVLAIASHELRAPIGSMQLQLGVLQRAAAETASAVGGMRDRLGAAAGEIGEMRERMQKVERHAGRLARLIDELLSVTNLQFGRLVLKVEETDLAELARDAVATLRDEVERSGSTVTVETAGPVQGRWDPVRIEQVLANLLLNASKYGEGKPITVSVTGTEAHALVSVVDHGMGIRPEDQQRIFRQFERAVAVGGVLGLGLGLYIANQIVRAHGGSLRVTSVPGEGATFTVDLPRTAPL